MTVPEAVTGGPYRGGVRTIGVGSWGTLSRCDRRLALHLDPEGPKSANDDLRFRLGNAVAEAVRTLYRLARDRGVDLHEVELPDAPTELEPEERAAFVDAVAGYLDAVPEAPGRLDDRSGEQLDPRPARNGRFALSGRADLVLRRPDGTYELHVLGLGARAHDPDELRQRGAGLALVLRLPLPVSVVGVSLLHPSVVTVEVDDAETVAFGRSVSERVEAVLELAHPAPTPDWHCTTCPGVAGCPAVPQPMVHEVLV